MASVVGWLAQLAGALRTWAGWPGSNGSTMGTNAPAAAGPVPVAVPPSTGATGFELVVLDDEEPPPHPAVRPISAAATAARARWRLITPMIVAERRGYQRPGRRTGRRSAG